MSERASPETPTPMLERIAEHFENMAIAYEDDDKFGLIEGCQLRASACREALSELASLRSELLLVKAERDERRFPVNDGPDIPWSIIAPYEKQAMQNHGRQTLERLAARGGLSTLEAIHVLECKEWGTLEGKEIQMLSQSDAIERLTSRVASLIARRSSPSVVVSPQSGNETK